MSQRRFSLLAWMMVVAVMVVGIAASTAQAQTIDEAKAAGALKENASINIPVKLKEDANGGLVRVEAIAYFCEDDGPCQVSGVLFEVPVALDQADAEPLPLKHTFNPQAGPFGSPPETTP